MDELKFKFEGGPEMERKLEKLGLKAEREVAIKAIRVGGKILVKEARRIVRKNTGNLGKSLGINTIPKRFQGAAVSVLARSGKRYKYDGWYASLVEFGTRKTQPKPFMRPAFEEKKEEVLEEINKYLKQELIK